MSGLRRRKLQGGNTASNLADSSDSLSALRDQVEELSSNLFSTVVVRDVISNPASFLNKEYNELKIKLGFKQKASGIALSDSQLSNLIPRNSIIGYNVSSADSSADISPELFFPFFPGHLSLPVKPGESVWVIYDQGNNRGYWLSRKVSFRQCEDLNYTAATRELPIAKKDYMGSSLTDDEEDVLKDLTTSFNDIANLPMSIDDIVGDSIAYKEEFIGEPVPRYSKKCGDLTLQGSNNTLISLGTDRSFSKDSKSFMSGIKPDLAENLNQKESLLSENDNEQNKESKDAAFKYFKPEMAGCIELVAGRSINTMQEDDITVNARTKGNKLSYFEYKKTKSLFESEPEEDEEEGDFTLPENNPLARFYVSMRSMPNDIVPNRLTPVGGVLSLGEDITEIDDTDINQSIETYEGKGESAIVSSAYSIKSFAKGNCELQSEAGGAIYISDGVILASKGGAYIHLKPNGDISIVPGKNGLIKLGGEEARLTSLCSYDKSQGIQTNFGAGLNETTVKGIPLFSTAGGGVGIDSAQNPPPAPAPTGTFATKILLK